jgi:HK97 family phage prohead protease
MREIRTTAGELRAAAGNKLAGVAVPYNSLSEDLGGFQEMFLPGAFADCLAKNPDVRCLWNHDSSNVLGRTTAGTLRLKDDALGLHFECDLPSTSAGQDARVSIERGDVTQCSFAFVPTRQRWVDNGNRREIHAADLFEVSPVTFPAYPQSSVKARAFWPGGIPSEVKMHVARNPKRLPAVCYRARLFMAPIDSALENQRLRLQCELMLLEG